MEPGAVAAIVGPTIQQVLTGPLSGD